MCVLSLGLGKFPRVQSYLTDNLTVESLRLIHFHLF